MQSNKDAAVALATAGMTVFPCGPDKKARGPWKDASPRPGWQVAVNWSEIDLPALSPGKHGMVVIDCDTAKPNRQDGRVAFAELCKLEGIDLSSAFVVTTPSGGLHFYWKTAVPFGNSTGALPKGIDVRGLGGYVIGPGAILPDGRCYRHDHGTWAAIPALPEALAKYLRAKDAAPDSQGASDAPADDLTPAAPVASEPASAGAALPIATDGDRAWASAALVSACEAIRNAPEGERNSTLNNQALGVAEIAANCPDELQAIGQALKDAAIAAGLGEDEADATIRSAFIAGLKRRRLLPSEKAPSIPLDGLFAAKQAPPAKPKGKAVISVRDGSQIAEQPIEWLWNGFLPKGKLTLLAGAGGTGKSTIAFSMAATVTNGSQWPDGTLCPGAGNVLIWSSEDDPADTIKPRLMAVNAEPTRYGIIDGINHENGERDAFDPALHMESLRQYVEQKGGIKLFIIDPIVTAVTGDMHRANDVRRSLQPIVDFAAEMDCAVLGITHFAKGTAGKNSAERVIGSAAFKDFARMVLVAAKDEASDRRVFTRAKSNNSVDVGGFSYNIEALTLHSNIVATRVVWGETLEGSSRSILAAVEEDDEKKEDDRSQQGKARQFLLNQLRHGPSPAKELIEHAREALGISVDTLRRAQKDLDIKPQKIGLGGWMWELPAETLAALRPPQPPPLPLHIY